jgi:hypothetical protein
MSAHAPSVTRGFITGLVLRILRLTSFEADQRAGIRRLFQRLCARGYTATFVRPLFEKAIYIHAHPKPIYHEDDYMAPTDDNAVNFDETMFCHIVHHPFGPTTRDIQRTFHSTILHPPGERPIYKIRNDFTSSQFGGYVKIRRLIVAQHRVPNLKNLLFPRQLRPLEGREPSIILGELRPHPPTPQPTTLTINPYS